ncbi:MAG: hypothetical protein NVS4B3_09110 [Gemmatimonadaceae bacterium]
MPQLDRLLSVLVSNHAESLLLREGEVAQLDLRGVARPITKQPLTGAQLVGLLREIAPSAAARHLDAGEPASFTYTTVDGAFAVHASKSEGLWNATLGIDDAGEFARQTGQSAPLARSMAAEVPIAPPIAAPKPVPTVVPAPAPVASVTRDGHRGRIDALLTDMIRRQASDLHLRCGEPPVMRTHGEMTRIDGDTVLDNETVEAMLASIIPPRNASDFAADNDADFAYEIECVARFRVNVLRDRRGAAAVFRVIPAQVVTVDQLGISPEVQRLCYLTKGLVLITGPTGSGKSTTLCSLIDLVNRERTDHVITIEDPIEFVHPNKNCIITQRQVGVHTSSFKSALRAALREDPDIILVGELRDLETVSIAIETAETGHLVFGTLHTTTAAGTIDRIIDQFPADRQAQIRVMLAESLKGVISQTLCKRIGGGRVAVREVLLTMPSISNLIREGKTFQIPSVMQTSRKLGMVTLNDALIDLVDAKQVEPKEAYMKAVEKTGFAQQLRQRGHDVSFLAGDPLAPKEPTATKEPPPAGARPALRNAAGSKR